jgi:hypothetical protein
MRPYDSVDYRYTSDDADKEKAASIVGRILGFRPELGNLDYNLNFYSGGTGIDDRLAIRCSFRESDWPVIAQQLRLKYLRDVADDPDWEEAIRWLIGSEKVAEPLKDWCHRFINTSKRDFQDAVDDRWEVFFTNESDVNSWCVVWRASGVLNYLSFDQG